MMSKASRAIVACNIYVSAGGHPLHRELLMNLLREAQDHCFRVNRAGNRRKEDNSSVAVVHAFRDGPYDRTSFHLAGSAGLVENVGSSLVSRAVDALIRFESQNRCFESKDCTSNIQKSDGSRGKRHPTVGLVDHVSILPLEDFSTFDSSIGSTAGSVARSIGESLKVSGAEVLYYGSAHPSGKELAAVRRESTGFFGNEKAQFGTASVVNPAGKATVGAPTGFVENFNIRLRSGVSKSTARTLTNFVRERGGQGLPFVEALTLKYGRDQYEVACNLLDPSITSAKDIEERMKEWDKNQKGEERRLGSSFIDTAYRVGTTADMCLKALEDVRTEEREREHNDMVKKRFEADFREL